MTRSGIRLLGAAALVAALVGGCRDERPKPPDMLEVFPNLPLPPNASYLSHSGGEDALQLTFVSKATQAQVDAYYRDIFKGGGWRLVSQAKDPEGAVVLLAEQDGPPLWVRIRPTDPSGATVVELSGALSRHAGEPAAKPAS